MQDLYAATFVVESSFEDVSTRVASWAHRGDGNAPDVLDEAQGTVAGGRGYVMRWQRYDAEARRAIEIVLTHPDNTDPDVVWRSVVDLSENGGSGTSFTLRITREGTSARLAPAALSIRRPGIVKDLLRDPAAAGGLPLKSSATTLSVNEVSDFVSSVLRSPARTLPALVLALPPGYERPLVAADVLADELAGLCHVFVLAGHLTWRGLLEEIDYESRVPQGGARLFWPGWPSSAVRHPWWTRTWLTQNGGRFAGQLFGMLARLSVIRTARDPVLDDLRRSAADEVRKRATDGASEELQELLAEYDRELTDARQGEKQANDRLLNAELEILELKELLEAQRGQWAEIAKAGAGSSDVVDEPATPAPTNWEGFAAAVGDLETDALRLTETAKEMLDNSPYPDPERMWWALTQLRDAGDAWRAQDGKVGARLREWVQTEFEIEISLQDKKLRGNVDFEYDGEVFSSEAHVKVDDYKSPDKCGRIYFAVDSENLRFLVDHVGLHR